MKLTAGQLQNYVKYLQRFRALHDPDPAPLLSEQWFKVETAYREKPDNDPEKAVLEKVLCLSETS